MTATNTGPANTGLNFRYIPRDCPRHQYVGKWNEGHSPLVFKCTKCLQDTSKVWECKHCGLKLCNMCFRYGSGVTGELAPNQPRYITKDHG